MPKKMDWLDIIEQASEPKKGTKVPKGIDVYSLTMLMYPSPNRNPNAVNGSTGQFGTGAGADGVVQPEKAAAIDMGTNPPSVYHEGETVIPFPGGKQIIPAKTEEAQQSLGQAQKRMGFPGFQAGGFTFEMPAVFNTTGNLMQQGVKNQIAAANNQTTNNNQSAGNTQSSVNSNPTTLARPMTERPTSTVTPTSQQGTYQAGVNQAFRTTQQRAAGADALMENISNRALQDYDMRAAVSDTATRQSLASQPYLTEGAKRAVTAKQQATYNAGLSGLAGDLSEQSMQRAEAANTELYNMGRTGIQDETAKTQWEKTFGEQQYQSDVSRENWEKSFDLEKQKYGDQEFSRMADDAQTTSLETWLQKYPNATETDYNTAREFKNQQLRAGESSITAQDIANDAALLGIRSDQFQSFISVVNGGGDLAAANAASGLNLTEDQFNSIAKKYRQSIEFGDIQNAAGIIANLASENGLRGDQLTNFLNAVNNGADLAAANQISGLNLTQEQYNSIATTYRQQIQIRNQSIESGQLSIDAQALGVSGQRLATFIDAVNGGSDLAAANAASGLNLTQDQYDQIATKYRQGVQVTEAQLASLQNKYGDEIFASIKDMINSGATLNSINERLKYYGMGEMSRADFEGMLDASALGERNWGRQMTAANMLLTTPGAENKYAAEAAYENLFPGVDFDFEDIANEERYENYADGLASMASYVAAGMKYEDVKDLLYKSGIADKMGTSVNKLESIYKAMNINAVDSQWNEMEESDFYKGLKPEEQAEMQAFFRERMLGHLDYDTLHEYEITGPDGYKLTVYGKTSDEADKKAASLGTGYSVKDTGNVKFQMASTITDSGNAYDQAKEIINGATVTDNRVADPKVYEEVLDMSKKWDFNAAVTQKINPNAKDEEGNPFMKVAFKTPPKDGDIIDYEGKAYKVDGPMWEEAIKDNKNAYTLYTTYVYVYDLSNGTRHKIRAGNDATLQLIDI